MPVIFLDASHTVVATFLNLSDALDYQTLTKSKYMLLVCIDMDLPQVGSVYSVNLE